MMTVPVYELETTEPFLAVLDGFPANFTAERAVLIQQRRLRRARPDRGAGERRTPFHELVCLARLRSARACVHTAFLAPDALPAAPRSQLPQDRRPSRTNIFHLPVRGKATAAPTRRRPTSVVLVRAVRRRRSYRRRQGRGDGPPPEPRCQSKSRRYGLGFWLHASADAVLLTGIGCRSLVPLDCTSRDSNVTRTVISNTSHGTWPVSSYLDDRPAS